MTIAWLSKKIGGAPCGAPLFFTFDRMGIIRYSILWLRKQQDFVEVEMEDKAIVVSMTEENQVGQVSLDEILAEIRFNWIDMYRAADWSP